MRRALPPRRWRYGPRLAGAAGCVVGVVACAKVAVPAAADGGPDATPPRIADLQPRFAGGAGDGEQVHG